MREELSRHQRQLDHYIDDFQRSESKGLPLGSPHTPFNGYSRLNSSMDPLSQSIHGNDLAVSSLWDMPSLQPVSLQTEIDAFEVKLKQRRLAQSQRCRNMLRMMLSDLDDVDVPDAFLRQRPTTLMTESEIDSLLFDNEHRESDHSRSRLRTSTIDKSVESFSALKWRESEGRSKLKQLALSLGSQTSSLSIPQPSMPNRLISSSSSAPLPIGTQGINGQLSMTRLAVNDIGDGQRRYRYDPLLSAEPFSAASHTVSKATVTNRPAARVSTSQLDAYLKSSAQKSRDSTPTVRSVVPRPTTTTKTPARSTRQSLDSDPPAADNDILTNPGVINHSFQHDSFGLDPLAAISRIDKAHHQSSQSLTIHELPSSELVGEEPEAHEDSDVEGFDLFSLAKGNVAVAFTPQKSPSARPHTPSNRPLFS